MISDFLLFVTSVLLFITILALSLYYRRIRTLRQEYERARGVVEDIVIGVDSQFRRQKDRVLFVAQKVEALSLGNKKVVNKIEEYEVRLSDFVNVIGDVPQIEEKFSGQFKDIKSDKQDM